MLKDLDDALEKLLGDAAAPQPVHDAEVSFVAPDRAYAPGKPTLNLFLHELRENLKLRDPEPIVEPDAAGLLVRRPPPLRLDCEYLVTAWDKPDGETAVRGSHSLLGLAYKWLSRFPTLPNALLTGALASQAYPPPIVTARTDGRQAMGEFWSALGATPRPGFALVVTVAVDPDLQVVIGPPVTARDLQIKDLRMPAFERLFQIAGVVRDAAGAAAPGAQVSVAGFALTAATDADGRYRLELPAAATYRLTATNAAGAAGPQKQVQAPPTAADHYDLSVP